MPFSLYKAKKLRFIFIVYWILLLYIVAALVWWFIALNHQNAQMTKLKTEQLQKDNPRFNIELQKIQSLEKRKTAQYIGEGVIFFLLIIAGAVFIYHAVRRQFKSSQQQQNFMMAITHELKTPIAVAKLNLETLLKRQLDEQHQRRLLQNTIQEANRLNTLCNNILLTSQMEAGDYKVTKERIVLSDLVNECTDDFITRFPHRKIVVQVTQGIFVDADTLQLQMAFNNLIDNAIKYSPKESTVTVLLYKEGEKTVLSIKDEGKGIAENEKEKVFEKFYRTGNEATKMSKGTGLGLYLTKKIAAQHNAMLSVKDNSPAGSIFTVTFNNA